MFVLSYYMMIFSGIIGFVTGICFLTSSGNNNDGKSAKNLKEEKNIGNEHLDFLKTSISSIIVCSVSMFQLATLYLDFNIYIILILDILYLIFLLSFVLKFINRKFVKVIRITFIVFLIIMIAITIYDCCNPVATSIPSSIKDSPPSSQEISAFNSGFETYTGKQTGSQVKALLTYCTANAKTYEDEIDKVPKIHYSQLVESESEFEITDLELTEEGNDEALKNFIQKISELSKNLELNHTYRIILTNDSLGMIKDITIQYDVNNFGVVPGEEE